MADPGPGDKAKLHAIFFPYATKELERVAKDNTRFVHYTSAEAAVSMIKTREVWMRQTSCMTDYSEVRHGLACVQRAYVSEAGRRLQALLNNMFRGLPEELNQALGAHAPLFISDTYVTCVSEHDKDENEMGRLSMWRAYGRRTGVAIVVNSGPFTRPSDALGAWSSPVFYPEDHDAFTRKFEELVNSIEKERDFIAGFDKNLIHAFLFNALRFAAVCTKHRAFLEEREWRVVHYPFLMHPSPHLRKDHQVINGVPQRICKLPLKDFPNEGLFGIEIPTLVERVIIGPTQYPAAIWQAFVDLLRDVGMQDPENKVVCSNIPLRT